MRKRIWIPAVLALALVLAMSIGPAWSYFTATTSASGGAVIHVEPTTDIEEPDVSAGVKHVVITNVGEQTVFVRVRAFAGDYAGTLTYEGEGWTDGGDGWWYYDEALEAQTDSSALLITVPELTEADKSALENGENFSVVVVHESTPAVYDEATGTLVPDWQ